MKDARSINLDTLPKEAGKFLPELLSEVGDGFYFRDPFVSVMIDRDLPVIEAVTEWLKAYTGGNSFVNDVKGRAARKPITPRQARAVLNCIIKESKPAPIGAPVSIGLPTTPAPAPKPEPHLACFKCGMKFYTMSEVIDHKRVAHIPEIKCRTFFSPGHPCGYVAKDWSDLRDHRKAVHETPLFEGVAPSGLDLSSIPKGRYAVPDLRPGKGMNDYLFLTVSEVNKDKERTKKYRFGFVTYGTETVAAGTLEMRQWHGDAKELIGEQRPSETYRGDFLPEWRVVVADWAASSKLFGFIHTCCGRCGKTLTDTESRKRGIGPECIKHFHGPELAMAMMAMDPEVGKKVLREKLEKIGRAASTTGTAWAT